MAAAIALTCTLTATVHTFRNRDAQGAMTLLRVQGANGLPAPCDVVTTCVASYSVRRRVVGAYSGNLFQLSKSGGTTQNIGQSGTNVDKAAINTFCGSNNANDCRYHIIYDQSGNGNDLTCGKGAISVATVACTVYTDDIEFTWVGSWGTAPTPSVTGTNAGNYFNNAAPTGTPTGNASITVAVVGNDSTVHNSTSHYGIDFGVFHATNLADTDLTNFGATIRSAIGGTTVGKPVFRYFGLDLETTSLELIYGLSDGEAYTTGTIDALSQVGDFAGVTTYNTSGTAITVDMNNGWRSYSNTIATPNWGNGSTAQLRLMAGGDATRTPGIWYEGLIYASAKNSTDQATIEANQMSYYGISAYSCGTGTTSVDTIGRTTIQGNGGAWGVRVLDRSQPGPIMSLLRTSDNHTTVIGNAAGTCNLDTTTASTFCNATTCEIDELFEQVLPAGHKDPFTAVPTEGTTLANQAVPTSSTPTLTFSCLGSLACMSFTGASNQHLSDLVAQAVTRPYTVLVVGQKASGSSFEMAFGDNNSGNYFFGSGSAATTVAFFAGAGSQQITGLTNGSWTALAGMVPTTTTITICTDGTCSTASGQSTVDIASAVWTTGDRSSALGWDGTIGELLHLNGTAISNGTAATISTNQHSYWGF